MVEVTKARSDRKRCWWIFDWFCRLWQIIVHRPERGDPCVVIPGHVVHKPDPCIYSQFMLMQLDQPVTWDNPDVAIFKNGMEQDTYNLTADTEYDIQIEVHNSSREKPAAGTTAHIRWIEFGAGGQTRHPIDSLSANVPVWPGIDTVTTQWRTPATPGHYCLEVELVHPDDGNPANNRGWNNTQVHAAASTVEREIRIFNEYPQGCPEITEGGGPWLRPHRLFAGWGVLGAVTGFFLFRQWTGLEPTLLRVATSVASGYGLMVLLGLLAESGFTWMRRSRKRPRKEKRPDRIDCNLVEITADSYEFEDDVGKDFDPADRFQGKAPEWPATVDPSTFLFSPGEAFRDVKLTVEAPDGPGPSAVFNVNVRQGGQPTGGVTITITRPVQ